MAENMEDLLNLSNTKKNVDPVEALRDEVVNNAQEVLKRRKGNNYIWGAKGPNNFDCSGLTKYVYKASGLYIPDGSVNQSAYQGLRPNLKKNELKPGDLVFFGKGKVNHVAIYIGNGQIIDSGGGGPKNDGKIKPAGQGVRVKSLNYRSDFRGGVSLEKVLEKNKNNTKNKTTINKGLNSSEKTISTPNQSPIKNNERMGKLFEYIFKVEGGYSNHKNDKGGATNFGITEAEARRHGYKGNMKEFPKDKAKEIYTKDYYYKNNIDKISDDRVALSVFDWSVHSGKGKMQIQKVLNEKYGFNLAIDGIIGKQTLAALNSVNSDSLLKNIHSAQRDYYKYLVKKDPSQKEFLNGWNNRVDRKEAFINDRFSKKSDNEIIKNLSEKIKEIFSSSSKEISSEKKSENNVKSR